MQEELEEKPLGKFLAAPLGLPGDCVSRHSMHIDLFRLNKETLAKIGKRITNRHKMSYLSLPSREASQDI